MISGVAMTEDGVVRLERDLPALEREEDRVRGHGLLEVRIGRDTGVGRAEGGGGRPCRRRRRAGGHEDTARPAAPDGSRRPRAN